MKTHRFIFVVLLILHTALIFGQPFFYVATTGNNSNAGTSLGSPWLTVQYALDHAPSGATIIVRGGVYNEKINWSNSGSIGMPTVLTNYMDEVAILSGNGIVSQTPIIHIENKSNLHIMNMVLEDNYMAEANGIYVVGEGQGIKIEGCIIRNVGFTTDPNTNPTPVNGQAHGILINGRTAIGYSDIFIGKNELHHLICGNSEALTLVGNVFDFSIDNNSLHDNTNIGIDVAGHYTWAIDSGVPASLNQARNGTVNRNIVHDHRRFSNNDAPAGIYCDGCKDVTIERNFVFRNGNGISVGCENVGKTAENVRVANNFIYDNDNNGVVFGANTGDITNCSFRNNTCLKNGSVEYYTMEIFLQKSTNSLIANNILYARTISHYAIGLFDFVAVNLSIDHNLVFREGGDLSELITGDPTAPPHVNTISLDPLLVKPILPSPDFHLQPSSPAINQGENSYVAINEKDLDIGNRIENMAVECGADEFGSQACIDSIVLNSIIPNNLFQATDNISSNGFVESNADVIFRAFDIVLKPGFQVQLGGLFSVEAASCVVLP